MDLVCHVISQNQVIQQSSDCLGRSTSKQVTIATLIVIMSNNAFGLSSDLTEPRDKFGM